MNICRHIFFGEKLIKLIGFIFSISLLLFVSNSQQLVKEAHALHESTICELKIIIKIALDATKPLPLFVDYIKY